MSGFDDKEKAAENKYAHDREAQFKMHARAHKIVGLWAAGRMGLSGKPAEEYAISLVTLSNQELLHKLSLDLLAHDIHISDHDLRLEVHKAEEQAKAQVK